MQESQRRILLPRTIIRYEQETLSEYICDVPGCPNVAEHVLGVVRELRAVVAVCGAHAPRPANPPMQVDQARQTFPVKRHQR